MCQEETSEIESVYLDSQSVDSIPEPSPELKPETPEEEDPLPLEFLQSIEPDLFEDFGNTSRYFCQRRPSIHVTPTDPLDENYLRETIQELTTLISNEWLKEGESSLTPIHLNSPSSSLRCRLQDQDVEALYNPTVGANLMSDEFALAFLGNYKLTPTDRQLKRPSGSLTSSYRILTDMPFWHYDVKVRLNFHVFEDLDFDCLIGHPLKALFKDVPKEGCLNIKLGKDTLHIQVDRALKFSVEDLPTPEPIEEIMATSTLESFDLNLE